MNSLTAANSAAVRDPKVTITLSVPYSVDQTLDDLAAHCGTNRSAVISALVKDAAAELEAA